MTTKHSKHNDTPQETRREQPPLSRSIFAVPTPIKQLFDRFPLITYPANELPLRAPKNRNAHTLYIYTTDKEARVGAPSYNPACLRWQAYLKFCRIDFKVASLNNHASPSGSLPFLLPSTVDSSKPPVPISSGKLQRWGKENSVSAIEEPGDLRYEAYLSLLDHRIRRAWLYSIYLSSNSISLAEPLYILPNSSNPFVRLTIARELRQAAENELLKFSALVDAEQLHKQAEEAFAALEMVLGDEPWFFGAAGPGLFDANVFAYTHLLMDDNLGRGWVDTRLRDALLCRKNLMSHRNRILATYFS